MVRRVRRAIAWLSLVTLAACGGGGSESEPPVAPTPPAPQSSATLAPTVRSLSAEQQAALVFIDASTLAVPSDIPAAVGDVLLIGQEAWKLTASLPLSTRTALGRGTPLAGGTNRFSVARVTGLAEVFTDLVIDGRYDLDAPGAGFVPAPVDPPGPAATGRKQALAAGETRVDCVVTVLEGQPARRCSFEWKDGITQFQAELTMATGFEFARWSPMTGSGSGSVKLPYQFKGSLSLAKDYPALQPVDGDACYSGRKRVLGDRIHLGELAIPVTIPGPPPVPLRLIVPLCMTVNAKAGIEGRIIAIEDSGQFEIQLRDGALPDVRRTGPALRPPGAAQPEDLWRFGIAENDLELQVAAFKARAEVELGLETGFEVQAYKAAGLGVNIGVMGSAFVETEFAVATVQRLSASVGGVPFSQWGTGNPGRLCLDIGAEIGGQARAFASLPAFAALIPSPVTSTTLFELDPVSIAKARIGACDLRVPSVTSLSASTTDPLAGQTVTVAATAGWNPANESNPDIGRLWRDAPVDGTVTIFVNGTAPRACQNLPVSGGGASCEVACPAGGASQLTLTAQYAGSEKTLLGSAAAPLTLACREPQITHWRGSYAITGCTGVPTGTTQWHWMNPCFAALPNAAATRGTFYFDDESSEVVVESSSYAGVLRSVVLGGLRSTSSLWVLSVPTAYHLETLGPDYQPRPISANGTLSYTFTVLSRTADSVSGTFRATLQSGWFQNANQYAEWKVEATEATGTWSAVAYPGPRPATQMGTAGFCSRGSDGSSIGVRQMLVPSDGCNPDLMPGWCGPWEAGLCKFE